MDAIESSSLFVLRGAAEIGPVNVWPQIIAAHDAAGFTLDIDRQLFAAEFSICDIP